MPEIKEDIGMMNVKCLDKGMSERFDKEFVTMSDKTNNLIKDFINQEIQQALQRERNLWLEKMPKEKPTMNVVWEINNEAFMQNILNHEFNKCLQEVKEIIK